MTVLGEENVDLERQTPTSDERIETDKSNLLVALSFNIVYLVIFGILNGLIFYSGCGYDLVGVIVISIFTSILLINITVLVLNHKNPEVTSITVVLPIISCFVFFLFMVYYTNCSEA